jgi:hypothetical protein
MKLQRSLRWAALPLALGAVVVPVAALNPAGVTACLADLRDAGDLTRRLEEGGEEARRLDDANVRLHALAAYKHELIASLAAGDTTLAAATDELVRMHAPDDLVTVCLRGRFGDRTQAELMACHALDLVRLDTPVPSDGGTPAVLFRLRADFERRFGHPAPDG